MENVEELKEAAGDARRRVAETTEKARAKSQELWENTAELIRENPGLSIGIALVSGMALGALLSVPMRRGSDLEEGGEDVKSGLKQTLGSLRQLLDDAITKLQS